MLKLSEAFVLWFTGDMECMECCIPSEVCSIVVRNRAEFFPGKNTKEWVRKRVVDMVLAGEEIEATRKRI